jgi:hypothetical protein
VGTTKKTPDDAGMARGARPWRRRPRATAARQALRLYEAELARLSWDTAAAPPGVPGQPRTRVVTARAALRAVGVPPHTAAALRRSAAPGSRAGARVVTAAGGRAGLAAGNASHAPPPACPTPYTDKEPLWSRRNGVPIMTIAVASRAPGEALYKIPRVMAAASPDNLTHSRRTMDALAPANGQGRLGSAPLARKRTYHDRRR